MRSLTKDGNHKVPHVTQHQQHKLYITVFRQVKQNYLLRDECIGKIYMLPFTHNYNSICDPCWIGIRICVELAESVRKKISGSDCEWCVRGCKLIRSQDTQISWESSTHTHTHTRSLRARVCILVLGGSVSLSSAAAAAGPEQIRNRPRPQFIWALPHT